MYSTVLALEVSRCAYADASSSLVGRAALHNRAGASSGLVARRRPRRPLLGALIGGLNRLLLISRMLSAGECGVVVRDVRRVAALLLAFTVS